MTVLVAVNILLVIELNYPFHGAFKVGPDGFQRILALLRAQRMTPARPVPWRHRSS
jgi:hypothetical protein